MSIDRVYERLAPFYDAVYGGTLESGRRLAMMRLAPLSSDTILEIGVGTGLSAMNYPKRCHVVGIDLSAPMLARAQARLSRAGARVALCRMDAGQLAFADAQFDAVYAAYVINVVPDPVRVAREMVRVCRPGGRLVFLNHFRHNAPALAPILGRMACVAGGVNWDLNLNRFLHDAGLTALSVEGANMPRVSSVVVCRPR